MKHKDGLDAAAVLLLLLVAVIAMVVPVALISPQWLIVPLVLVVVAFCVLWYGRRKLRSHVAAQLCSTDFENSRVQYSLAGLPIPTMLVPTGGSYGIIPSSGKKSWQAAMWSRARWNGCSRT